MTEFKEYLNEQLKDPEFRAEYEALEPEFNIKMAIINACKNFGLTRDELAGRCRISRMDIEDMEAGDCNPTLSTLQRLASGMGMRLKLKFEPIASE